MNEYVKKSFDELTFCDDFMFKEVIGNPKYINIAKQLIEMILERKIYQLRLVTTEKEMIPEYEAHGVRFDALFEADGAITVIEMQTYKDALPLRAKYYNDVIDVVNFKHKQDYEELPETIVIFLMDKDYLNGKLQKYTVKSHILEDSTLKYDDKRTTIFINPEAYTENDELNVFCEYLRNGRSDDGLTEMINKAIQEIKENTSTRRNFMSVEEHARYLAKQSEARGRKEEKEEIALEMLNDKADKSNISKYTHLSIERINELEKKLKL